MATQHQISNDAGVGHFSSLLKHWRNVRRLTQIELAADANVSARHLCFLETGRAQPSREMVQLLGSALDLPLEERNALHVAAGFVPPYGDLGLAADNLQPVRQALDFILRQQEPYPGIVIDGHWDVRIRNDASRRLFKAFHQSYDMEPDLADNAMHVVFHPKGLRQFIVNWDAFAGQMIQILHREVAQGSRVAAQLLDEIMTYPGLPAEWRLPRNPAGSSPVMTMQLQKGDFRLAFFSTFTTLAMPADAALQKLNRMLLSGGQRDCGAGAPTGALTKEIKMQLAQLHHSSAETVNELRALNARFIHNFVTNDVASHDAILHPRFINIWPTGQRWDRATYLKYWATAFDPKVIVYWDVRDELITVIGDVALVRSTNKHTRRRDGKEVTGMTMYTDTYLFENGAWKCIQAQLTPVAPEHQPSDDTIVSVYIEGKRQERPRS
jgi:transcriptional regulator with XRE-family HTH domain